MDRTLLSSIKPLVILSGFVGLTFYSGKHRNFQLLYHVLMFCCILTILIIHIPVIYFWIHLESESLDSFLQLSKISIAWVSYFTNFIVTVFNNNNINKLLIRLSKLNLKPSSQVLNDIFWNQILLSIFNISMIVTCQVVAVHITPEEVKKSYSVFMYILIELVSTMVVQQFVGSVILVKTYLKCMTEEIKHFSDGMEYQHCTSEDIVKLRVTYSELYDISRGWNSVYQIQLLASLTKCFVEITFSLTSLFEGDDNNMDLQSVLSLGGAAFNALIIVQICYSCHATELESKAMNVMMFHVANVTTDDKIMYEVKLFCIQTFHQQFYYSVLGLFNVDFKLLQEVIAAISSYLIIIYTFSISRT